MTQTWLSQTVASAFLEAYRRCDPSNAERTSKHFMAFPAVVCAAFSAEVGLKTMLENAGLQARGHDLRALFLKLPDEKQLAILKATDMPLKEFAAQLAHSRLAFSEWRYIYEGDQEKHINVRFLGIFAAAVEVVATGGASAA